MKRRVIKKNINRYITPILKGLPRTTQGAISFEEDRGGYMYTRTIGVNRTIINGFVTCEGVKAFPCDNLLLNIKRTGERAAFIISTCKDIYVRLEPEIRGRNVRIRLITEKVTL